MTDTLTVPIDAPARVKANAFINMKRLDGCSMNTLRAYTVDVMAFLDSGILAKFPLEEAIPTYIGEIREAKELAPSTLKRRISTLRMFGQFALDDDSFMARYRAPVVAPGKAHPLPGLMDDVRAMIDRARQPHHKALIALCGRLGLRVEEARNVRPSDFSDDEGIVIHVQGKGDKGRSVPVSVSTMVDLTPAYTIACDGNLPLVPISDSSARRAITRIARLAGVTRPVSSHDLRHTFATAAYDKSHDIRAVQELLGHSSVETTQIYTGVAMAKKRVVADV